MLDTNVCAQIDSILDDNKLRAPIFGSNTPLRFDDRQVAAKTGTTNEWRDDWTVGYTPGIVAGVWAGNNDNSPMAQGADGVFSAAPIWRDFMNHALANSAIEKFPDATVDKTGKPVLDGDVNTDKQDSLVCKMKKNKYCIPSGNSCPNGTDEKQKKISNAHNILYWVNKDDPRGAIPKNPQQDPQFNAWESGVQAWAAKNGDKSGNSYDPCN